MSLLTACLFSSDDEDAPSTPVQTADMGEMPVMIDAGMPSMPSMPEPNERIARRSPETKGDEPAHRQTRRSPAPALQERRSEGPESEPCEAESLISSDGPALVFRNLQALSTHLPFSAAIAALSTSGGGTGTAAEQNAIIQSMIDTFANPSGNIVWINSESNALNGNQDADIIPAHRPNESAMQADSFIAQMKPLATFNRLDLTSTDGSICGEQRITYALGSAANNQVGPPISGQFTIIFEARYPNPLQHPMNAGHPLAQNLSGTADDCLAVAEFWESIAMMNDDNDRAIAMAEFFFTGHTVVSSGDSNGVFLPPVVHFVNYQTPLGQIRTNQFVDNPWELREFRTDLSTGVVTLVPDTIKGNPVTALYDANSAFSLANPTLRQNFMSEISAQMDNLLTPEIDGLTVSEQILSSFEPTFPDGYSSFASISQGGTDDPAAQASADLRALISTEIAARLGNSIPANSTVDEDHVLNRLGAMTCGGCHQYSSNSGGVAISDTLDWPLIGATQAFVQVRDVGNAESALSAALTGTFLPLRREFLLNTWLCETELPAGCMSDDECDDGFICVAGECVEEPTSTGCQTDDDCPQGYICDQYGDCVLPVSPITVCDEAHAEISEPTNQVGSNENEQSEVEGSCGGSGAEDLVIFTPEVGGTYCMDTKGSTSETIIHVRQGDCRSMRSEIACATSVGALAPNRAELEITFESGVSYFIFVDSLNESNSWMLNIREGECPRAPGPDPDPEPVTACDEPYTGQVLGLSLVGDSSDSSSVFTGTCGGAGAEDVVQFVPTSSGAHCLNTAGSQIHTAVYVRSGMCDGSGTEIGCSASLDFPPNTSPADNGQRVVPATLELDLQADETYFIFVDALIFNQSGDWGLTVTEGTCRGTPNPGNDDDDQGGGGEPDDRDPPRGR